MERNFKIVWDNTNHVCKAAFIAFVLSKGDFPPGLIEAAVTHCTTIWPQGVLHRSMLTSVVCNLYLVLFMAEEADNW